MTTASVRRSGRKESLDMHRAQAVGIASYSYRRASAAVRDAPTVAYVGTAPDSMQTEAARDCVQPKHQARMDTPLDIATFRSDRFVPFLPEECQVNPEVYGAELAWWLSAELARRGVVTSYPEYEDWGWYIEFITTTGSEFAVLCGNVTGCMDRWTLALRRHAKGIFGRDKPSYSEAAQLVSAIREALPSVARISDIEWLYPDAGEA